MSLSPWPAIVSVLLLCSSISAIAQQNAKVLSEVQSLKPEQVPELINRAESGDPESQLTLAVAYRFGRGVSQNLQEAAKWFRKASDGGSAPAANDLGLMYQYGMGVAQNDVEAANLFQKSAGMGNAPAQANMGFMYEQGRGVQKDLTKSLEWTAKSAAQGYVPAEMNLGIMYLRGEGTQPDRKKATEFLTKAAEQGYIPAEGVLGLAYLGFETPEGDAAAFQWLSAAAAHGDEKATKALHNFRNNTRPDLTVNSAQDLTNMRSKADSGNPDAQNLLGVIYSTSMAPVSAYFWFSLAAENPQGAHDARKGARDILKLMPKAALISEEQIGEAKVRLAQWHADHPGH
jgi:uncharacterized protein